MPAAAKADSAGTEKDLAVVAVVAVVADVLAAVGRAAPAADRVAATRLLRPSVARDVTSRRPVRVGW